MMASMRIHENPSKLQNIHNGYLAYTDLLELPEEVERRIQALVTTAELLGLEEISFTGCLGALTNLSSKRLALKQSMHRTEYAVTELETHLAIVEHEQRLLNRWKDHFDETLTSDKDSPELLERKRQALLKKAREYKHELDSIKLENPPVTVSDLSAQQDRNKETEERIREKRTKLNIFQGLPPNLDIARAALKKAGEEQMYLIQTRERLLESMAEGMS